MININNTTCHEMQIVTSRIMEYLRKGEKKEDPELIIVTGAIGSGKTTYIKKELMESHVWIDTGRYFIDLVNHDHIESSRADVLVDLVGIFTLDLAIIEKRNIVVELIAADRTDMMKLIDRFRKIGYSVRIIHISSTVEECYRNNLNKSADNMSCFFYQHMIFRWLKVVLSAPAVQKH